MAGLCLSDAVFIRPALAGLLAILATGTGDAVVLDVGFGLDLLVRMGGQRTQQAQAIPQAAAAPMPSAPAPSTARSWDSLNR